MINFLLKTPLLKIGGYTEIINVSGGIYVIYPNWPDGTGIYGAVSDMPSTVMPSDT
ncbi:MAG: hypothetical protein JEZ04_18855 [Spirochaetales bacterium]|nr:hypothetical protein [Spirochaetales bacterium]